MPHTDKDLGSPYVQLAAIVLGAIVAAFVITDIITALVR